MCILQANRSTHTVEFPPPGLISRYPVCATYKLLNLRLCCVHHIQYIARSVLYASYTGRWPRITPWGHILCPGEQPSLSQIRFSIHYTKGYCSRIGWDLFTCKSHLHVNHLAGEVKDLLATPPGSIYMSITSQWGQWSPCHTPLYVIGLIYLSIWTSLPITWVGSHSGFIKHYLFKVCRLLTLPSDSYACVVTSFKCRCWDDTPLWNPPYMVTGFISRWQT